MKKHILSRPVVDTTHYPKDDINDQLIKAIEDKEEAACRLLVALGADINTKDEMGWSPLHVAVFKNNCSLAKFFLERGAKVDSQDLSGNTPLHYTLTNTDCSIAYLLVEHNAPLDAQNNYGDTIMHLLPKNNSKTIFDLLAEKDANFNVQNKKGKSPLHVYVSESWMWGIRKLLKHGADVNLKDEDGNTPLHLATYEDNDDVVELLLKATPDLKITNNINKTAYDLANYNFLLNSYFHIISQITKLEMAFLISPSEFKLEDKLAPDPDEKQFKIACIKELEKIKSTKVLDFNLDVVFKKQTNLYFCLTPELMSALDDVIFSRKCSDEFPVYKYILRNLYKIPKAMFMTSVALTEVSAKICGLPLPTIVVDIILSYLSVQDLNIACAKVVLQGKT